MNDTSVFYQIKPRLQCGWNDDVKCFVSNAHNNETFAIVKIFTSIRIYENKTVCVLNLVKS